ncbi:MAG: protein-export membrane protein SecF [Candidatus Yanofskybacteria bacterium RIFCSPHIGHO2_02_FULL_50_12]|uniref:Protein-export membrane protein SecF n=1 Tax=Candidatus Yanofskybacteria bacterium RIFCSPHIGHO2_02_FULL_50_12 TaxID=1802685 RepID=A0A1F8FXA4_9BACT|nr:MAG: protein-export membrane protein SecF [Candidatus Yanofskybacteria bacterium RIFCSPHIGHO2_02_FULL_50_12]
MKPIYSIMFVVSLVLFGLSVIALAAFGLNFGVDFKGGSILELEFRQRPGIEELRSALASEIDQIEISPAGDHGYILRTHELSEQQHQAVLGTVADKFPEAGLSEKQFSSVGPAIGQELRTRSLIAIAIVLVLILLYIAVAFRKLSGVLSLWNMNIAAVVGLLHDIVIPLGVFAILGRYYGVQISAIFVAAILTILGYTVSDKVVIFDRVRENILRGAKGPLGDIVHKSVMQTLVRSINNTLTVVLSSAAIFFFGGESIRYFALALMIGIFLGAYSSIFVASPLLVWLTERRKVKI